jgi:hypothetical protein
VPEMRARQIGYVVAGGSNFTRERTTLAEWLAKTGAQLVAQTNAIVRVTDGPQPWYVARLPEPK